VRNGTRLHFASSAILTRDVCTLASEDEHSARLLRAIRHGREEIALYGMPPFLLNGPVLIEDGTYSRQGSNACYYWTGRNKLASQDRPYLQPTAQTSVTKRTGAGGTPEQ
jgi:hypothetical protein